MEIKRVYTLFSKWFRKERVRFLYREFGIDAETRVVDVGGTLFFWEMACLLGLPLPKLTIVNLSPFFEAALPHGVTWIVADGCGLPFKDHSFDLAFSNSVIEHLGSEVFQYKFAREVQRVARSYFVQTPNRLFPIEPHFLTPFIGWFPTSVPAALLRNLTLYGLMTRASRAQCSDFAAELRLLTAEEVRDLFPRGDLKIERFLGLAKSLIVYGRQA
jgi:hypothetical protein